MTSHVRHRRSYDPAYSFPPIEPGELAVRAYSRTARHAISEY